LNYFRLIDTFTLKLAEELKSSEGRLLVG